MHDRQGRFPGDEREPPVDDRRPVPHSVAPRSRATKTGRRPPGGSHTRRHTTRVGQPLLDNYRDDRSPALPVAVPPGVDSTSGKPTHSRLLHLGSDVVIRHLLYIRLGHRLSRDSPLGSLVGEYIVCSYVVYAVSRSEVARCAQTIAADRTAAAATLEAATQTTDACE